jgi:5-(carboxyamino)imidazole ribonucleotide mutase
MENKPRRIAIIMGSKSDEEKMLPAVKFLQGVGVPFEVRIASAHRTPELLKQIVSNPSFAIFIAGAGMAAALPGCIAALTTKPVIGVPLSSKYGLEDSLLSIIQMPPGIPVLTVGLDAAKNAAIAACEILAMNDEELETKLKTIRQEAADKVYDDDSDITAKYS